MISATQRYNDISAQIRASSGNRGDNSVACGKIATTPLPGYDTAEIMPGSHVDNNPESVDLVHVWNSRQVNGNEEFAVEAFVDYTHRGMIDRWRDKPGDSYLHHYVTQYVRSGGSGSQLVDVALTTLNPHNGEVRESLQGRPVIDRVWRLEEETGARITS